MQPCPHALGHAGVVGRMKLDEVDPTPLSIVRPQPWGILVSKTPLLERLRASAQRAEFLELADSMASPFPHDGFAKSGVRGEQVHVHEWRRLIWGFVEHVTDPRISCSGI